ncbi:MAG: hypothetical protein ABL907_02985 [Hyphomicrobium sp.]
MIRPDENAVLFVAEGYWLGLSSAHGPFPRWSNEITAVFVEPNASRYFFSRGGEDVTLTFGKDFRIVDADVDSGKIREPLTN